MKKRISRRRVLRSSAQGFDPAQAYGRSRAAKLWAVSEELVADYL